MKSGPVIASGRASLIMVFRLFVAGPLPLTDCFNGCQPRQFPPGIGLCHRIEQPGHIRAPPAGRHLLQHRPLGGIAACSVLQAHLAGFLSKYRSPYDIPDSTINASIRMSKEDPEPKARGGRRRRKPVSEVSLQTLSRDGNRGRAEIQPVSRSPWSRSPGWPAPIPRTPSKSFVPSY